MRKVILVIIFGILSSFAIASDSQEKIDKMFNPVVKILTKRNNGASGTIIYSEEGRTLILTNYHVIEQCVVASNTNQQITEPVNIEILFVKGRQVGSVTLDGFISCYDQSLDLALIEVAFETTYVAKLLPIKEKVELFSKVWVIGHPLLQGKYITEGIISSLPIHRPNSEHGNKATIGKINAPIYGGSSGGAIFTKVNEQYYFIGVPQSLQIDKLSGMPIAWMGNFISLDDVRSFLCEQGYDFVLDQELVEAFEALFNYKKINAEVNK